MAEYAYTFFIRHSYHSLSILVYVVHLLGYSKFLRNVLGLPYHEYLSQPYLLKLIFYHNFLNVATELNNFFQIFSFSFLLRFQKHRIQLIAKLFLFKRRCLQLLVYAHEIAEGLRYIKYGYDLNPKPSHSSHVGFLISCYVVAIRQRSVFKYSYFFNFSANLTL